MISARPMINSPLRPLLLALALLAAPASARTERLALAYQPIDLPGAPSALMTTDLDGDGHRDLAVVAVATTWDQITVEERARMDDVEGLVEVMTIVPALLDRRELHVFRGRPGGGFERSGEVFTLGPEILTLEPGPVPWPLVALTDEGLSGVRLIFDGDGWKLDFETLLTDRPVLAGSGNFVPRLGLVAPIDGENGEGIFLPTAEGLTIYRAERGELARAGFVATPREDHERPEGIVRFYPLPRAGDLDGDETSDLLLRDPIRGYDLPRVARGLGGGKFGSLESPLGEARDRDAEEGPPVVWIGDLDGDGRAEVVTQEEIEPEGGGMRQELRHARRPPQVYRLYRTEAGIAPAAEPYQRFDAEGYAFEGGDDEIELPGGFQDLNGDGRLDLVTLTLDFSIFQAVRILATRRIHVGIDFHVFCQGGDGRFTPVTGLDLSGKFRLDLDNLRLGRLAQFAGDFDGDGRADFVQMGRGRRVTIHRGGADCSYPEAPDLVLELEEEPWDLALVAVRDLDGDGRADLSVIQPGERRDVAESTPVRLDLYLSRSAE